MFIILVHGLEGGEQHEAVALRLVKMSWRESFLLKARLEIHIPPSRNLCRPKVLSCAKAQQSAFIQQLAHQLSLQGCKQSICCCLLDLAWHALAVRQWDSLMPGQAKVHCCLPAALAARCAATWRLWCTSSQRSIQGPLMVVSKSLSSARNIEGITAMLRWRVSAHNADIDGDTVARTSVHLALETSCSMTAASGWKL